MRKLAGGAHLNASLYELLTYLQARRQAMAIAGSDAPHPPAAPSKLQQLGALSFHLDTALRFQCFNNPGVRVFVRRHFPGLLSSEYNWQRQRGTQRAGAHFAGLEVGVAVLKADRVAAHTVRAWSCG